ncbi:MAG: DinB family protein [Fimbriimonas sp.]
MAHLEQMIGALDEAHWEFTLAFEGLADEDLWRRADPRLLSVGELAGHVMYWEAVRSPSAVSVPGLVGPSDNLPNLELLSVRSPLINHGFRYYTTGVGEPVELGIGTAEVLSEMSRIHQDFKAALIQLNPHYTDLLPGSQQQTWGQVLQYQIFHVAYHTGQAYSVRHLLGHTTTDN